MRATAVRAQTRVEVALTLRRGESLLLTLKDQNRNDFELWYGLSDLYQKQGQPAKARAVLGE